MAMRILFVATGDIALPPFRRLLHEGLHPLAVITQPDKPVGRHQVLTPPAIRTEAEAAGIPVHQPVRIGDITEDIRALRPDVIVVMAYGQILREPLLSLPGIHLINLHASLLPRHRGAACIQAAIDAGDTESGITAIHVVKALDAGDMIHHRAIPITPDETGGSLHDKLADLAADVLMETLDMLANKTAPRIPQNAAEATYISKLSRDDGKIDWHMPANEIERRIRAYHPWPGTHTLAKSAELTTRVKIFPPTEATSSPLSPGEISANDSSLTIGCGNHTALHLHSLQPEGSKRMTAREYLTGHSPERFV
jgi:methionyl-tRNA formyltransferase